MPNVCSYATGVHVLYLRHSNHSSGALTVGTPSIDANIEGIIDTLYEMRLETLLSVDDLVSAVMKTLEVGDISNLWMRSKPSVTVTHL